MENFNLYLMGVKDSLRLSQAFIQITSSPEILKKTFQCMLINGGIYLGSVILYNFFISTFFSPHTEQESGFIFGIVKLIMALFYNLWIFIIYIMAMTLTTYWVQDIFDELIQLKLQRLLRREGKFVKNPGQYLKQQQQLQTQLSAKERSIDLIQRTLIISLYLMIVSIIGIFSKIIFNSQWISGIIEVFLYSILHAYYCYEYKTALMDIDFATSIDLFEAQWAYFSGFGFIFTSILYFGKQIGSSLFFLLLPLMVVISVDENGQGLLAYEVKRESGFKVPSITLAYVPNKLILRWVNRNILQMS